MANYKKFWINMGLLWSGAIANLFQLLLVYKITAPKEFDQFVHSFVTDTKFTLLMLFAGVIVVIFGIMLISGVAWIFAIIIKLIAKGAIAKSDLKTAVYMFFLINTLSVVVLLFSNNQYLLGILNPFSILASFSVFIYLRKKSLNKVAVISGVLSYVVITLIPGLWKFL